MDEYQTAMLALEESYFGFAGDFCSFAGGPG